MKSQNKTYQRKDCFDLCVEEVIKRECNCKIKSLDRFADCWNDPFILKCVFKMHNDFYLKKTAFPNECYSLCPSECDLINYRTYQQYLGMERDGMNRINVYVYFPKLEYTLINQIPKANSFDLISSVGGTLSLFIGISFFTLIELIEIMLEFMLSKCFKKKNSTEKSTVQTSLNGIQLYSEFNESQAKTMMLYHNEFKSVKF
jgi:hypothetical protein